MSSASGPAATSSPPLPRRGTGRRPRATALVLYVAYMLLVIAGGLLVKAAAPRWSGLAQSLVTMLPLVALTVVLVAADGEWTRRRAGGESGARRLSERLQIPVYDVQKVGYPQRMRDFDARRRIERKRAAREELDR